MKQQLTGDEEITLHVSNTRITVMDFWFWAFSNLICDTRQETMAKFLVYSALNQVNPDSPKHVNRLPYDITSPSGRRIKIKSAAYIHAFSPENIFAQIKFDIDGKPAWNDETATYVSNPCHNCDLYVFCLFTAYTNEIPVFNLDYWDFYIISASVLNENKIKHKRISLSSLLSLKPIKTNYTGLKTVTESIKL